MNSVTGTMYDGLGERLKGDGASPKNALKLMAEIEHKALLHDAPTGTGPVEMVKSDRFYLVSEGVRRTRTLPMPWMCELAEVIAGGGRVGVMAHDADDLAAVTGLLRRPHAVLAQARRDASEASQLASGAGTQSVGMLGDGGGNYLDGDKGQAVAWQIDETRQFRAFLNGSEGAASRSGLLPSDRFYMMPADYEARGALPVWIVAELMKTLNLGGKVLVVAPSRQAFDRLVKVVSEPERLLLAIEPTAGHA